MPLGGQADQRGFLNRFVFGQLFRFVDPKVSCLYNMVVKSSGNSEQSETN